MAYTKHDWQDNEVITRDLLNNIEAGIEEAKTIPGATTEAKGTVKKAAKIDAISVANAVAAKDSYTKADIEGMVALINKNKEVINAILEALKTAEIMNNA